MGRNRIYEEVNPKEFVKKLKLNNKKIDLSRVSWKDMYETKIKSKVEIPSDVNKVKVRHGVYDLSKV